MVSGKISNSRLVTIFFFGQPLHFSELLNSTQNSKLIVKDIVVRIIQLRSGLQRLLTLILHSELEKLVFLYYFYALNHGSHTTVELK